MKTILTKSFFTWWLASFMILFIVSGVLYGQNNALPLLDISKNRIDFGETKYLKLKTTSITFKNIGDTTLTIYSIDKINSPFGGNLSFPDTLEKKGDSVSFTVSYKPFKAGIDSQRVFLRADTRLSHSIGLLFDVSESMNERIGTETTRKIDAAVAAGRSFIGQMLATSKVWDEAGVFSFASNFTINQDFTTNKTLLINSLPTQLRSSTAFYNAVAQVIIRLEARPFTKVLIALTDGEDNASKNYNPNSIIALAKAKNVKIYTIGVGSDVKDNELNNIATSTGGLFFKANSSAELQNIYYKIFNLLSKNIELYFDILGKSTTPDLSLQCLGASFVRPGDPVEYEVDLRAFSANTYQNSLYRLSFNFNRNLLFPLDSFDYNPVDGTTGIYGIVNTNLDSMPLKKVRFVAMLGDTTCTDVILNSLKWINKNAPIVSSGDSCSVCMNFCAGNLRTIRFFTPTKLLGNTPNPFSGTTSINFIAGENGSYDLKIYDSMGREVKNVFSGKLSSGEQKIQINASDLPKGLYFYTLMAPDGRHISSMINE